MADQPLRDSNQGKSTTGKISDAGIAGALSREPVRRRCENIWTGGVQGRSCEDLHNVREYLDSIAPPHLAEEWDKVGLLSAPPSPCPVARIFIALDLTPPVRDEMIQKGIDLLVCYHPPIFKPLERLCAQGNEPASLAVELAYHGVAIYSPHTALDAAVGGTNDVLAAALRLRVCGSLVLPPRRRHVKLVVFVPESHVEEIAGAVFTAGAGRIGNRTRYSQCSFRTKGTGTFFGDESTSPAVGEKGRLEFVPEVRFETVVPISCLDAVVQAMRDSHPYEEPAFDLLTMENLPEEPGLGRLAALEKPLSLAALAQHAKQSLGLNHVQLVGPPDRVISMLVVLAGSCGRLPIEAGGKRSFDAVITGELKHHDMLALRAAGISALCLGHGRSEKPALRMLRDKLAERFPSLEVQLSSADVAPYQWV